MGVATSRLTVMVGLVFAVVAGPGCAEGEIDNGGEHHADNDENAGGGDNGQNDDQNHDDNDGLTCAELDCDESEVCDPEEPECVECLEDGDCPEVCVPDEQVCVECVDDEDCQEGLHCDPDDHQCVGCVDDEDCEDELVCDVDGGQTCLECLEDDDCGEGQQCDTEYGVCFQPCCEFVTESFGQDRDVGFGAYEVLVDDQKPVVALADSDTDEVVVAVRDSGDWYYEVVDTINGDSFITSTPHLAADLDDEGRVHVALSNRNKVRYYRPSGTSWEGEVVDEFETAGFFDRVGLIVDGEETAHIVTEDGPEDGEFHYYWREAGGSGGGDVIDAGTGEPLRFVDLATKPDGTLVLATTNYGDVGIHVFDQATDGAWSAEALGGETSNAPSVAVDADGDTFVVTSGETHPVFWQRTGGGWQDEPVADSDDSTGLHPRLDLDEDGEPVIVHHGWTGEGGDDLENRLFYSRRVAGDWETHDVGGFSDGSYPKLAYDEQLQKPHIAARNTAETRLEYYTFAD